MFREIPDLVAPAQVEELRRIAAAAQFVDGRITNPHNAAKQNLQLHDQNIYQQSATILLKAFASHEDFRNFAFPVNIAPPLLTLYRPGMHYGAHTDMAFIQLPPGPLRSDLSCTVFLSDPASYQGGALAIHLGTATVRFKGSPGSCIVYPSDTLHQVEPVTEGQRLVAITFIQSRIADPWHREMLYEINEVAALEGLNMAHENYTRLQLFQQKLLRYWADKP